MARPASKSSGPARSPAGVDFLLAQVGAHAAMRFAARLEKLKLKPYHAGILRVLANGSGVSQQGLGNLLGMFPSRLVAVLDELAKLGLIERRDSLGDRRSYALHLTKAGRKALSEIGAVVRQHQADLCSALNEKEKKALAGFLSRIAAQQKITPGVHPGYRRLGRRACD